MKERPILFSTPMVQAILEGRKTMTRRIIKPQIPVSKPWYELLYDCNLYECPHGQVGDRLWVRETFQVMSFYPHNDQITYSYKAGGLKIVEGNGKWITAKNIGKWKSSIFMPKAAARIWLEITNIRVERLQDIDSGQASCEGYPGYNKTAFLPLGWFFNLWESLNGEDSWEANPYVWVISFKRIQP